MKMDAFVPAIPELVKSLGSSGQDAHRAAVAITTTDLVSKEAALQVRSIPSLLGTNFKQPPVTGGYILTVWH